jgi:hypothetical protein
MKLQKEKTTTNRQGVSMMEQYLVGFLCYISNQTKASPKGDKADFIKSIFCASKLKRVRLQKQQRRPQQQQRQQQQ